VARWLKNCQGLRHRRRQKRFVRDQVHHGGVTSVSETVLADPLTDNGPLVIGSLEPQAKQSFLSRPLSFLDRSRIIAPASYSRWLIPPAALAIHLSIGQVYALSVFKPLFEARFNVAHTAVGWIFSIAILMLGLSAAFAGTWVERVGPRKAMALSTVLWVSGFLIGSLGIASGHLWLLYLGYGVIGGMGLGIGYVSPVSTLIKWFPDRPGMATGLAIMGFGGGAAVAAPLSTALLNRFSAGWDLSVAGPQQISRVVVLTFLALAAIYLVIMVLGLICIRIPAPGWKPAGWEPKEPAANSLISHNNVSAKSAIRTPQFWLLWVIMFVNITAGISVVENASIMIGNYFPALIAGGAAGYVGLNSLFNMGGRFGWSSLSDKVGRKNVYIMYLGLGAVLFLALSFLHVTTMWAFLAISALILSFYGGGFATLPAYIKDLFGGYQVSAIHGRVLTAWSAAGIAGPLITNTLIDRREAAGLEGPALYAVSLRVMATLLIIGFVANLLIRPVAAKWHEDVAPIPGAVPDGHGGWVAPNAADAAAVGVGLPRAVPIILWILVGGGLAYGIFETVLKALHLF